MTTEYFDPDGVFSLLWPQLSAQLPLRNLYWKSPARPLRSISCLHVDFVPAAKVVPSRDPQSSGAQALGSSDTGDADTRRHQIPGLRSTPYLKLFLLRCDDRDLYKSKLRPRLREWVKEHVTGPQTGRQQSDHDAFEWLILHVVLPDTPAAAQPRFSSKKNESDDVKERSSKFPGKRNRPLLEKLRSDFNDGKSGFERVAQIRLAREALPPGLTRASLPEGVKPIVESPQEQQAAWNDLVAKFKALILSSFNVRVTQYEEDVREKELQRSLPGWNFCTFFILKEGLAQAFEAVGLTEDALLGYDELMVGLDSTISDQLGATSSANQLSSSTPSLFDELSMTGQSKNRNGQESSTSTQLMLDVESKDYRGLIVNNQISTFDFRCYIFMRQMALLLKLARLAPSFQNDKTTLARLSFESLAHKNQDATPLAELSNRATAFASLIGRTMRAEMHPRLSEGQVSCGGQHKIDAIIASWTFMFLQQILDETITSAIASPASMQETRSKSEPVRHYSYPKRQSSLVTENEKAAISARSNEDVLFLQNLDLQDIEVIKNTELANAAACRADLVIRQRRLLELLGEQRGWRIARLREVEADMDNNNNNTSGYDNSDMSVVSSPVLEDALSSAERFRHSQELLSDHAAWYYAIAGRTRSAEQLIISQALLKFGDGDFAAATTYFSKLAKTYGGNAWRDLETSILIKYATCLDALNRKDELVRVRLAILAKSAGPPANVRPHSMKRQEGAPHSQNVQSEELNHFEALLAASRDLTYDVTAPLTSCFQLLSLDKAVTRDTEDGDGFSYAITISKLIQDEVSLDDVQVHLVPTDGDPSQKLVLSHNGHLKLCGGHDLIKLQSNVSTYEVLRVERIVLRAGRILFAHDIPRPGILTEDSQHRVDSRKRRPKAESKLLVYPRLGALRATLRESATIHLNTRRALQLSIQSGDQSILEGVVTLKSLTAGLRLHTAEATMLDGDTTLQTHRTPGNITIPALAAGSTLQIRIPYSGEHALDLAVLLEVKYRTEISEYVFGSKPIVNVGISLDVSVQDVIKKDAMISKFWIKAMTGRPIRVLDMQIEGSESLEVQPLLRHNEPIVISERCPLCTSFRIHKKESAEHTSPKYNKPLLLRVRYRDIMEDLVNSRIVEFKEEVRQGIHAQFDSLLVHCYEDWLNEKVKSTDLSRAERTGKSQFLHYELTDLSVSLQASLSPEQLRSMEWLQEWHNARLEVTLETSTMGDDSKSHSHELLIDFTIPKVDYAFSVALIIPEQLIGMRLGQSHPVTLQLSYSNRWSKKDHHKRDFVYEIDLREPSWLVSGVRTASFSLDDGQEITFDLAVIPLLVGVLTLPSITVRLAEEEEDSKASLYIDLRSRYRTVHVVEDRKSTTVALDGKDGIEGDMEMIEAKCAG